MRRLLPNDLRNRPRSSSIGLLKNKTVTPVHWSNYFDEAHDIDIRGDSFRLYEKKSSTSSHSLILIHGAGHSALTWAVFAKKVHESIGCNIYTFDLRGHGMTLCINEADMKIETLVEDAKQIVLYLNDQNKLPGTVTLIGHSLGGSIVTRCVRDPEIEPIVNCLIVLDVVEGSAMSSLKHMRGILQARPTGFSCLADAIRWNMSNCKSELHLEALQVSIPAQLIDISENKCACECISKEVEEISISNSSPVADPMAIEEEEDSSDKESDSPRKEKLSDDKGKELIKFPRPKVSNQYKYSWRVKLLNTQPYWEGWFNGLSQEFLDNQATKLLLLCNLDRMDTTLQIGHMQGRYQMATMQCGHTIQEELPEELAERIKIFLTHHKMIETT